MPVAIRKRSWEDHVTPRTGLQYSYDDLDLVCCHVRYQRSRCASMPECSHHQPRTLLCPQEDIRDGRRTMERIVQKFKGGTQPSFEGVKCQSLTPGDTVNETAQHKSDQDSRLPSDNVADQDELQCSASGTLQAHSGDPDNKELNKDKVSASHSLTHYVLPTAVLAQIEETSDLSDALKDSNSVNVDCSEITSENIESMVKVSVGSQMLVHEHMSVTSKITNITNKPPTSDSQQKSADPHNIVEVQCCEMSKQTVLTCGKVECSYTDGAVIPNLSSSTSQEIHIPEASSDANKASLVSKRCIVLQGQDIENQEDDGIFKCSDHEMLKIGSLKPPACETSQLEPSGKIDILETRLDCFSKLQTIHEGSFPESGDDASAQILAEMPEHLASAELKTNNCENLTTSEDQSMSLKEPTGEEPQPEGLYDEHQANQYSNTAKDHESVPKAEGSLVKLRTRKSSREEREKERSSLDSMVLLIMKLDQLDKEIENALSSSLNSTPNLKRQIISEVDLEMLDSSGSLSASSQSLNTPLYRSSSSLSSSGPSGTAGARPKNE
ncbi:uncharacterized protein LOC107749227, partial [Sinocyclocheilus rhinocerous]|uniref:uncharacterized protein LOC107749227 n=1 Tax=Sinocyclocheilus rhinocerous TaxID=307959 RepID=UPI0007B9DA08